MKHFTTVLKTGCSLMLVLVFSMCSKTGPTGATGATGATGVQGPAGPQGSKGDTGTANVIYSQWQGGFSGTSVTWNVPAITQGILDSGVVLVYVQQNAYVYPLPYDNLNGSGFFINDLLHVGSIFVTCDNNDNLNEFKFRYIIIPGGVQVNDFQNGYQWVTNKFNITP